MRWFYLGFSALLLGAWLFFGNYAGPLGQRLPALGPFFNPAQGFWQNTGEGWRSEDLTLDLDHPLAGGEVHFDERGVPHLFAENLEQACFLQGYVTAYDRMWQIDLSARATGGELAELFGEQALQRDREQIQRGFRRSARRAEDTLRQHFPEDYQMLQAYTDGVNAYLESLSPEDYGFEYKLLDYEPARWSVYKSLLIAKGMSSTLSGWHQDVAATKTRELLGEEIFDRLFPERFPGDSPIVPAGYPKKQSAIPADSGDSTTTDQAVQLSLVPTDFMRRWLPAFPPDSERSDHAQRKSYVSPPQPTYDPDNGSNNWAVGPSHSNTGRPLLANDPHLSLTYPSVWYELQIHFPGCNARGVSIAGLPGLMMGFNDHIAWGETNVGHDVTDWYRIEWADEDRSSYQLDGKYRATELVVDTINVKGGKTEIISTPWTVFGPAADTTGPYADLARRWLAHDEPGRRSREHHSLNTFLALMQAKNYDDYLDALRGYVDPPQNFIMAAKDGTIAIRPNGFFPLRQPGQGRFVQVGDSSKRNWPGVIPFTDRPVHLNPTRGFISSANQVTTGPDYPYYYYGGFNEYRGRYINRVLTREPIMNQRTMKELQLDAYSLLAEELTPLLIARVDRTSLNEEGRRLLRVLSEWDYVYRAESRAPTLFERWRRRLYALSFDELPRQENYLRPEVWKWRELLATAPEDEIFDIDSTTNFRETAAILTQRAYDELLEEYGGELPPRWVDYRDARIPHLGRIPGFGSPRIETDGGRDTPRVLDDGFGGSWRMVIELGPEPRGWGALPGGAAGNAGSEFYDNGFAEWAEGRYHELVRYSDAASARQAAIGSWTFQ